MKWRISILKNVENCKVGKRTGCKPNSKKQAKEQGRSTLLKLLGWGCISPLFREIKETGSNYRAQSWLGIWGSADWKHLISGQVEHSQGHKSYSSFAWLMWLLPTLGRSGSTLNLKNLFQQYAYILRVNPLLLYFIFFPYLFCQEILLDLASSSNRTQLLIFISAYIKYLSFLSVSAAKPPSSFPRFH